MHPTADSCLALAPIRFVEVFRWMLPVYGALHVVPLLVIRDRADPI